MFLPRKILEEKLLRLLAEDVGQGDITTGTTIPENMTVQAKIVSKDSGVVAGIEEVTALGEAFGLRVKNLVWDGDAIKPKLILMTISGDARTILTVERTFLNLLTRMSGIATATRKLVEKIKSANLKTRVACTRKTAPGLSYFDKKAVCIGGGDTHRLHLDDMILIKDNHIAIAGSIKEAVRRAKQRISFSKKIEIEVTRVKDVLVAARAGADVILLDNFKPQDATKACMLLRQNKNYGRTLLEASGGITANNILEFASSGVDIVSLGETTSSPRALDISLDIARPKGKSYK